MKIIVSCHVCTCKRCKKKYLIRALWRGTLENVPLFELSQKFQPESFLKKPPQSSGFKQVKQIIHRTVKVSFFTLRYNKKVIKTSKLLQIGTQRPLNVPVMKHYRHCISLTSLLFSL